MRTDTPQTIYRHDYTPPSYLVDTVELGFDLDPVRTIVASRLVMRRNPASSQRDIELYGDKLETVALRMNGRPLHTLDAVASGATWIPLSLDYVAPPPAPVQPIEVAAAPTASAN